MPNPKHSHPKAMKSKKKNNPPPETADDVLAVGVEQEEAGEKWRAGDAAKSCRFFLRALETYHTGLERFPQSFDLAYNRARLQFDLAQQPRLLRHLPTSAFDLLQAALASHRQALSLKNDDTDTLFNTAQILTSIAEACIEDEHSAQALNLLNEAEELFERCLSLQENQYAVAEKVAADFALGQQGLPAESMAMEDVLETSAATASNNDEQWASIEEPVTKMTLLDTCLAAVQAFTTMAPLLYDDLSTLRRAEQASLALFNKAEVYVESEEGNTSILDFYRCKAKSTAALLRAYFTVNQITVQEYAQQLENSFQYTGREASAEALSESAEARVSFNEACAKFSAGAAVDGNHLEATLHLRWEQLSSALADLSAAAKSSSLSSPWDIQSRKAEVELLRLRLADPMWNYPPALSNKETLLKNAEVFYRGAKNLANANGENQLASEMSARESVIQSLRGEGSLNTIGQQALADMIDEGLLA